MLAFIVHATKNINTNVVLASKAAELDLKEKQFNVQKSITDSWISLRDQAYFKAKELFWEEEDFLLFQEFFDDKNNEIEAEKIRRKKEHNKKIALVAGCSALLVALGLLMSCIAGGKTEDINVADTNPIVAEETSHFSMDDSEVDAVDAIYAVWINDGLSKRYHSEYCTYVTDKSSCITLAEAKVRGYSPCAICIPSKSNLEPYDAESIDTPMVTTVPTKEPEQIATEVLEQISTEVTTPIPSKEVEVAEKEQPKVEETSKNNVEANVVPEPIVVPEVNVAPEPVVESGRQSIPTAGGSYIGHKKNKVLHSSACRNLPKESNRVYFNSSDEGYNAGYTNFHDACMY